MLNHNDTWNLDPSHSTVGFVVRHAGISKVRGEFTDVEARINGREVTATAQAASFDSGNADRDAHVKGADFFDVENYPTVDFIGRLDGENKLVGTLTIKGVSQEVTFELDEAGTATDPFGAQRFGAEASTVISRKDFGLTWNAALETGGVLVSDKVTINLDVSFIKADA